MPGSRFAAPAGQPALTPLSGRTVCGVSTLRIEPELRPTGQLGAPGARRSPKLSALCSDPPNCRCTWRHPGPAW